MAETQPNTQPADNQQNQQDENNNSTVPKDTQGNAPTYTQEQLDSMITKAVDDYKANNQPDISKYQQEIRDANIHIKAVMTAVTMGIDSKALPYIIKLADFKDAANKDGSVSEDKVKSAIEKVLTDIPALKKSEQNTGFKLGADANNTNSQNQNDLLKKAFGL